MAAPKNIPSLDEVRDKIEKRYAVALGQAELAQGTIGGRMLDVKRATRRPEGLGAGSRRSAGGRCEPRRPRRGLGDGGRSTRRPSDSRRAGRPRGTTDAGGRRGLSLSVEASGWQARAPVGARAGRGGSPCSARLIAVPAAQARLPAALVHPVLAAAAE